VRRLGGRRRRSVADLSTKAWLAWITLGVVNTGLANVVYYWLIKRG
jgi:drug/metabolite transporter (DMT)-like permease